VCRADARRPASDDARPRGARDRAVRFAPPPRRLEPAAQGHRGLFRRGAVGRAGVCRARRTDGGARRLRSALRRDRRRAARADRRARCALFGRADASRRPHRRNPPHAAARRRTAGDVRRRQRAAACGLSRAGERARHSQHPRQGAGRARGRRTGGRRGQARQRALPPALWHCRDDRARRRRSRCAPVARGSHAPHQRAGEGEVRRADGSGFWALISPVRFVFEWTPAVLAGCYDVTDRRRAEAGLREELERRQAELNEARALQLELAPPAGAGRAGGWEFRIDVALEPAREVGGDLVDYFRIDDRRLVLVVGDVSHKGAGAALFMARAHSLIRALASRPDAADLFATPAEVARLLNAALARDNARCMFVTLLLGVFDAETGALAYVRAGHVPPFVRRAAGRIERMTDLAGPPLGLVETAVYRSGALALGRGDQVLIVTDGLTEATDPSGAQFGDARLEAFLSGVRSEEPSPLARLISELRAFEGGRPAFDDVAAVLFATLPNR